MGDRAHEERPVDPRLGMFEGDVGKASVRMKKVILHINND
jgi:hypothetical protein